MPVYIGTQVIASLCAAFALKAVFEPTMSGGVTVPTVALSQAFALEFIISFNLMFVVTAVATDTRAVNFTEQFSYGSILLKNLENLFVSEKLIINDRWESWQELR